MKQYKELAGQTVIYGLGTIIPRVLNFLLTPLYTYILVTQDFGIITEMYSYVAFFMVLLTFGMETTFFRFCSQSKDPDKVFNNSFFILLITSAVFLITVFSLKTTIASLLGGGNYSLFIGYLAFILFFDAIVAIPLAKLRLENKALKFTLIRLGNISINIFLNIFFFVICRNSNNPFLSSLYNADIGVGYAFISNLVASIFNFIVLLPGILHFKFRLNVTVLKQMLRYTLPLVFIGIAGMINEVGDKLFLKFWVVPNEDALSSVGIYAANYKLAILMTIFIQVFKYAAEPFFFKHANSNQSKELYSTIMTWFIIFCLTIFLVVTLYISIFQYFIGIDYRSGLYIVPIILLANMFLGIYYNLSIWYKISDLTYLGAVISFIGMVITIGFNYALIPIYGIMGAAIATILCYFSMMVISYFWSRKHYLVNYELKKILIYFLAALIIFFIRKIVVFTSIEFDFLFSTGLLFLFLILMVYFQRIKFKTVRSFINIK